MMDNIVLFLDLVLLFFGIYSVFIAPLLFKFWIIPKIEKRYDTKLVFDNPTYCMLPFSRWTMPPHEISLWLVDELLFKGKHYKNKKFVALNKINYDIKTISKAEIIMALITFIGIVYFLLAVIVFFIAKMLGQ